jgi:hypothetical protein
MQIIIRNRFYRRRPPGIIIIIPKNLVLSFQLANQRIFIVFRVDTVIWVNPKMILTTTTIIKVMIPPTICTKLALFYKISLLWDCNGSKPQKLFNSCDILKTDKCKT